MSSDPRSIGVVVHPTRHLDVPIGALRQWAAVHDTDVVQVSTVGQTRRDVAPAGEAADCALVVALGGDGTTLAALHAAARADRPVLGVACGSLGALTATGADAVGPALDRFAEGAWEPRVLPAIVAEGAGERPLPALNDLVLVRRGAGQVVVEVQLDGEPFIRYSGDGLIAATPLGSSAYTLAAGGPLLAPGTDGLVLTPLAPHGGVVPPLVATGANTVEVLFDPGHGGGRIEVDGQLKAEPAPAQPLRLRLHLVSDYARLVSLGAQESMVAGLRRRRLLVDSPRLLARDERERGRGPGAASGSGAAPGAGAAPDAGAAPGEGGAPSSSMP